MFESIIMLLIYLCLFALVVYLVLWVLGEVGITIPPRVMQLFWVIVVLVAILLVFKMIAPHLGSVHFMKALGMKALGFFA